MAKEKVGDYLPRESRGVYVVGLDFLDSVSSDPPYPRPTPPCNSRHRPLSAKGSASRLYATPRPIWGNINRNYLEAVNSIRSTRYR